MMMNQGNTESVLKASCMAARLTGVLTLLTLLILPALGLAGDGGMHRLVVADLVTPEQFLEYATANEIDVHEVYFETMLYEGTESCLLCHEEAGAAALDMGHFKWEGKTDNIAGLEGSVHGKNDLLNNFCIAVPTNEGRCTQCHAGLGYSDSSFNFQDPRNVDCLVCHDQTGTYKKGKTSAGMPDPSVDLNAVARSIAKSAKPTRKNCIGCHANAGGGDNVKHGDLSTDLLATTREFDVHMGVDGADFACVDCHAANHDPKTGTVNHGNAGMSLHSVNEGEMRQCADCHGSVDTIHADKDMVVMFEDGWHGRLACQVCHIPAIARAISTKTEWYWSDAGKDVSPVPVDPVTGRPTFDKKKGTFVWSKNVRPTLRFSNGRWNRMVIGVSDTFDKLPIVLAEPLGDRNDPEAMIYPFKLMVGNQPIDPLTNTVLVPHLFGKKGGDNPFWAKYDWGKALADGAAYTGQNYSGTYTFAATEMLLSVNHEIAPAEQAFGKWDEGGCRDCHLNDAIDWPALGWSDDPTTGGRLMDGGESEARPNMDLLH
jgi:octaheme c-type cytochrome (tetrathionate reductase family)